MALLIPTARFKMTNRSHQKFDIDTPDPVRLPQPVDSIYGDLVPGRNKMGHGADFPASKRQHTISYLSTKGQSTKTGLLSSYKLDALQRI
jgi:hypothetical protein